jgi:hypothetical protein
VSAICSAPVIPAFWKPSCTTSSDRARKWGRKSAGPPNRRPPQRRWRLRDLLAHRAVCAWRAPHQVGRTPLERAHAPCRFLGRAALSGFSIKAGHPCSAQALPAAGPLLVNGGVVDS